MLKLMLNRGHTDSAYRSQIGAIPGHTVVPDTGFSPCSCPPYRKRQQKLSNRGIPPASKKDDLEMR